MADIAAEKETIANILGHCHSTCGAIEDRLTTIKAAPTPSEDRGKAAEVTPTDFTEALEADRKEVIDLLTRLRSLEDHVAAIQDNLKSLV